MIKDEVFDRNVGCWGYTVMEKVNLVNIEWEIKAKAIINYWRLMYLLENGGNTNVIA